MYRQLASSFIKSQYLNSNIKIFSNKSLYNCLQFKNTKSFSSNERKEENIKSETDIEYLKEFKEGMSFLSSSQYSKAVEKFKESSSILKSINYSETIPNLIVLKRLAQSLFYSQSYIECEKVLRSALDLSSNIPEIVNNKPELIFLFQKNLLVFYMYTNIQSASVLLNTFLDNKQSSYNRYFIYAAGSIKIMAREFSEAKKYLDLSLSLGLNETHEGHIINNMGVLKWECLNTIKSFDSLIKEDEEKGEKMRKEFYESNKSIFISNSYKDLNIEAEEKEVLMLFKLALSKYGIEKSQEEGKLDKSIFEEFCRSEDLMPKSAEMENLYLPFFSHAESSSTTISNITERLFEMGNSFLKPSGFWMKAGLQNKQNPNLGRHLVLCSLIYSQLGQSMIAEGLYRRALDIFHGLHQVNDLVNMSFCQYMYGRLLVLNDKRKEEGIKYIESSKKIYYQEHLKILPKLHYMDFDFN